jgi:hypothetical protein
VRTVVGLLAAFHPDEADVERVPEEFRESTER